MKKTIEKIDMYKKIIGYVVSVIGILWLAFTFYNNSMITLNNIQKTTLRTMIWSQGIPLSDKLEACDSYLGLGYNSETKRYCEELIEKEFKESELNEKS